MDIARIIGYIEENLCSGDMLSIPSLARHAGYSEYHFIRVFRDTVKLTPADYIRKRRISEIVIRIGESRPISDIAFEFGFNSKENFTRAFKKEHGILPTEYKNADCSLRLYAPFEADPPEPVPDVSLKYFRGFEVTAYPFCGVFPPTAWNIYNSEKRSVKLTGRLSYGSPDYGVMIRNHDSGKLDYYIGVRSSDVLGDISGTVKLDISEGLYAVFDTPPAAQHDFVTVIRRTWDWIYNKWLPSSGYRRGDGYEMESYTESSRTYTEKIFIPITK